MRSDTGYPFVDETQQKYNLGDSSLPFGTSQSNVFGENIRHVKVIKFVPMNRNVFLCEMSETS